MADENVIRREFQAELTPVGDGRTIDMRIVPYNQPTRVRDAHGPEYEEEWLPGVFDKQIKAANRVFVNVEHEKGFSGVVGKGSEFREASDGFLGSVRIDEGPAGDKALRFVNEGALTGISLEAIPIQSQKTAEGVVQRVKARLINVALCRFPAYAGAEVLAVREDPMTPVPPDEPDPMPDPPPTPGEPEPDPERSKEVLARIGYEELYFRNIVDRPWDDSKSRFTDEEFKRSCLADGVLPILEPSGDLNIQAMREAEKRLSRTGLSTQEKAQAARKLLRYYRAARVEAPPSLRSIASK